MQTTRRVDEDEVATQLVCLVEHVVANARGIGTAIALDDGHARALTPHIELLDGRGAERVGTADHDVLAGARLGARDLADRGGLASAVDTHEQHAARRIVEDVGLGFDEELAQALGKGDAQLIGGLEVLAGRGLTQVVGDAHGDLAAHVSHDEGVLQVLPEALIHLTTEVEDLVQGLAAALQSALEGIEQTH